MEAPETTLSEVLIDLDSFPDDSQVLLLDYDNTLVTEWVMSPLGKSPLPKQDAIKVVKLIITLKFKREASRKRGNEPIMDHGLGCWVSLYQLADVTGVPSSTIRSRYEKGLRGDSLIEDVDTAPMKIDGMTVSQWVTYYKEQNMNVLPHTIRKAYNHLKAKFPGNTDKELMNQFEDTHQMSLHLFVGVTRRGEAVPSSISNTQIKVERHMKGIGFAKDAFVVKPMYGLITH